MRRVRHRAAGASASRLTNCNAVPAYSGRNSIKPVGERRRDELARPELERALHAEALRFERLAVDLGEQRALVEVERTDRDGVVVRH